MDNKTQRCTSKLISDSAVHVAFSREPGIA